MSDLIGFSMQFWTIFIMGHPETVSLRFSKGEGGYNSDFDLDLLIETPTPVESNLTPISQDTKDVDSTSQSLSKRLCEYEIDCESEVRTSARGSSTKIEKP
ncbi:unnamed protein product [Cuscuta epithymum]|uniref:Uncharacterized protein n=1 Tax=Cuscuta epithymum TaxID=186058 RepID=A0AAV0GB94_9ASTE|nr:unnamed protein product [Cuscuta epithymum]